MLGIFNKNKQLITEYEADANALNSRTEMYNDFLIHRAITEEKYIHHWTNQIIFNHFMKAAIIDFDYLKEAIVING